MMFVDREEWTTGAISDRGLPPKAYVLGSCPAALAQIVSAGTDLAIWQRRLADDVAAQLEGLVLDEVDDVLLASEPGELETALAHAMEQAGYPDVPTLKDDIAMLARRQASFIGDPRIKIRLEVVDTGACRKFHADYVKVRTITTYLGQGTQWIEAQSAHRVGTPGGPKIRQLDTGAVAVFKGRLWQEQPAILHRSPPIGDSGERRLVLAIDPVPAEDMRW